LVTILDPPALLPEKDPCSSSLSTTPDMSDLLRESALGQLIRLVTRNKILQYPEEKADFELPASYTHGQLDKETGLETPSSDLPELQPIRTTATRNQLDRVTTRVELEKIETREDLERAYTQASAAKKTQSSPIAPEKLDDGTILVDWYTTDDPANPQNWSLKKKVFVMSSIE
jgi:DHA1 family multidrug resistance protein-like MFS transporter